MGEDSTPDEDRRRSPFASFIEPAAITLRRALVARNGVEDGSDAAAEAVAWAWEHPAEVESMVNPLASSWAGRRIQDLALNLVAPHIARLPR